MTALRARCRWWWGLAVLVALSACASAPARPVADPATAMEYSTELDAAQAYHEMLAFQIGETQAAGTIDDVEAAQLTAAAERLERALRAASAELQAYTRLGGPLPARAELRAAKAALETLAGRVYGT